MNKRNVILLLSLLLGCFSSCAFASFSDLQDPTRPENFSGSQSQAAHPWGLEAIIIAPERRIAVIHGQMVKVGDSVAGFKVVAIQSNTVHLEGPHGSIILFLFNHSVKRIH